MFKLFGRKNLLEEIKNSIKQNQHTPDRLVLERSAKVYVFEYGDMMKGFKHNNMLGKELVCDAYTEERMFLWNVRRGEGSFPIASKNLPGTGASKTRVKGELYLVASEHLTNLDNHRGNGVIFKRRPVRVMLPVLELKSHQISKVTAYMYLALDEFWKTHLNWDTNFYKSREGGTFAPVAASEDRRQLLECSQFTHYTKDNLQERDTKCFVYHKNGRFKEEPEVKKDEPVSVKPVAVPSMPLQRRISSVR